MHKAGLAQNSAAGYFDIFKTDVKQSADRNLLPDNSAKKAKSINKEDAQREFLTLEELKAVAAAEFKPDLLKRAAVFSALTGLRFSDIQKLTWGEIQHSEAQGFYIRFRQKKTKGAGTLPISDEAVEQLGARGEQSAKPFDGLKQWECYYYLPNLITVAGIDREVTFHAFRHTYATLQITLGTDIYTISKMLGHRKLETTQIYTKIINQKKREAANKITLK